MTLLTGILPIDKPIGWTSHDVVARVRRIAGQRQVGHAGTLDPLASGLLLLVLGDATRLSSYLMSSSKTYRAEVILGVSTSTDDAEGQILSRPGASGVALPQIEGIVPQWVGEIRQVPPSYAAVRQGGQRLYVLARKGIQVQPEPRTVTIWSIEIEGWTPANDLQPIARVRLRIRCGAGTYIRSLARDLGAALGTGGHLHALRRVESGSFHLPEAVTLNTLARSEDIRAALIPPDRALLDCPALVLSPDEVRRVRFGQPVRADSGDRGPIRMYDPTGSLVALGEPANGSIKPFRVFPGDIPS